MKKSVMIPIVILRTKTGFNAFSPVIDGCAVTEKTMDRTMERMKEALEFHFEGEHLMKQYKEPRMVNALRKSFDDYGTDAIYASLQVAA
jgi:predicted RNase H-like HicB family nuclease